MLDFFCSCIHFSNSPKESNQVLSPSKNQGSFLQTQNVDHPLTLSVAVKTKPAPQLLSSLSDMSLRDSFISNHCSSANISKELQKKSKKRKSIHDVRMDLMKHCF